MSLSLAIDMSLGTLAGAGGDVTPSAELDSFEIVATTSLDPVDVGGTLFGVDVEGVAAEVVADTQSGTPDPTKFSMEIRTPGYDDTAASVWRHTVLKGVQLVPKQATSSTYVNTPHTQTNADDGTIPSGKTKFWVLFHYDPTATEALTGKEKGRFVDTVFAESEIVSATVAENWWGDLTAGDVASPVNSSTLSCDDIPIEVHTLNLEREPNEGSTRTVRLKVSHLFGGDGKMFAAVKVRGRDANGNYTPYTTVTTTTAHDPIGDGETYVEIVEATYSTEALDDGVMCRDEYEAYPQIGTAPFLSTTVESDPNDMRYPQQWRNIRSTAFSRVYAVVESGATGGTASTTLATAEADPFGSWHAAYNAIAAVNNAANPSLAGSTTDSAVIYGRNLTGSDIVLDKAGNFTGTIGEACFEIKQHPDNTARLIFGMGSASHAFPTGHIIDVAEMQRSSTSAAFSPQQSRGGTDLRCLQLRNVEIDINHTGGTSPWCNANWERVNVIGHVLKGIANDSRTSTVGLSGTNAFHARLVFGIRNETAVAMRYVPYTWLGAKGTFDWQVKGSGQPSRAGAIAASFFGEAQTEGDFAAPGEDFAKGSRGYHWEQFVPEWADANHSWSVQGDGNTNAMDNVVLIYCGSPPDAAGVSTDNARINIGYCDVAGARGVYKHARVQLSGSRSFATKTCWFDFVAEGAGRVSNWKTWLRIGWMFNAGFMSRDPGSYGVAGSGDNPDWGGFLAGPGEVFNVGAPTVVDNQVGAGGGGDYRPTATSQPFATVPAGHQKYTYDLDGRTRLTDGTGFAWPYEKAA